MKKLLLVDDDNDQLDSMVFMIQAHSPDQAVETYNPIEQGMPGDDFNWGDYRLQLVDYHLGEITAFDWMGLYRGKHGVPPVIVVTRDGDERLAVKALKLGAKDYFNVSNSDAQALHGVIAEALDSTEVADHVDDFDPDATTKSPWVDLVGGIVDWPTLDGQDRFWRDVTDRDVSDNWPFSVDDVVAGKASIDSYMVNGYIGRGGMATVFKARHPEHNELVVLKILHAEVDQDDKIMVRFMQEFDFIKRLEHPHIIKVYNQGYADGHGFIAMEYVPGGDLKKQIRRGVSRNRALKYAMQIASALHCLHESSLLHRDLKPENVLIRDSENIVLADFGVAKQLSKPAHELTLTQTGMVVGTLRYSSPEQIQAKSLDNRSDQYSLGLILYEMLAGQVPFPGRNPVEVSIKHVSEDPPPLPEEFRDVQPLMDRLLAKKPEDRFDSTAEVETLLGDLLNE